MQRAYLKVVCLVYTMAVCSVVRWAYYLDDMLTAWMEIRLVVYSDDHLDDCSAVSMVECLVWLMAVV